MTWNKNLPSGTSAMQDSDDAIRANWSALETSLGTNIGTRLNYLNDNDIVAGAGISATKLKGALVQYKQAIMSAAYTTTSQSYVTPTGLEGTITPTSVTSIIRLSCMINMQVQADTGHAYATVYRGTSPLAIGDAAGDRNRSTFCCNNWGNNGNPAFSINFFDTPTSTSPTVYSIQVKSSSGGIVYVNRSFRDNNGAVFDGRVVSSILIEEISQ